MGMDNVAGRDAAELLRVTALCDSSVDQFYQQCGEECKSIHVPARLYQSGRISIIGPSLREASVRRSTLPLS